MIKMFLIPVVIMLSCGSTKSNQSVPGDSVATEKSASDTLYAPAIKNDMAALPACIKNKIDSFNLKAVHEKPQRVVEYMYKGKKVYYVVMPCCDFFSEVYDEQCKYLGAPDGGFTGKGDGKLPDFFEQAKGEKWIWGSAIPK